MPNEEQDWNRADAERHYEDVLDRAKAGKLQRIIEQDGVFEVRFIPSTARRSVGEALAEGGPLED